MANVFACGPNGAEFKVDVTGDVVTVLIDGVQVLAEQQAAISDAAVTATLTGVDTGTDMTAAQAATIVTDLTDHRDQINAILDALQAHGLIAT